LCLSYYSSFDEDVTEAPGLRCVRSVHTTTIGRKDERLEERTCMFTGMAKRQNEGLMPWKTQWHRHPGVRSADQLTVGERAADRMRNGMGSWAFVSAFFSVMAIWAIINGIIHLGGTKGFDPYPFILLNLFLSMLAGVQAAALLIAAKRSDQIASEIAVHTERTTDEIKALLQQNTELTQAIEALTKEVHSKIVGSTSG
jgi:uncharacterized membrane protein